MINTTNPLLENWLKDDINRINLATLLKEPTILEAIRIIRRNYQPTATMATMKDPVIGSASYHTMAGANEALDDLFQLASEIKKVSSEPAPREWSHIAKQL